MVEGTDGVRDLLRGADRAERAGVRFVDFLKATVLLSAGAATLLAALDGDLADARRSSRSSVYVAAGWWLVAAVIGVALGRPRGGDAADRAAAGRRAKTQTTLPELPPGR